MYLSKNLKILIYVYNNILRGVTERLEPKNLKNVQKIERQIGEKNVNTCLVWNFILSENQKEENNK